MPGMDGYLSKPLVMDEVLNVIVQHMPEEKIKHVEEILQAKESHV